MAYRGAAAHPPHGHSGGDYYADDQSTYSDEDDYTLPGYDDDIYSQSNGSMTTISDARSYDSRIPRKNYRVPREAGPAKPVYEAWAIYRCPDTKEILSGCRILGINFSTVWDYQYGGVDVSGCEEFSQSELANLHLAALDEFHDKTHGSCLPSFGKRKTYEEDLDDRVRASPEDVQRYLNRLLSDRESATATPWRGRDWTCVFFREQLHRRFSSALPQPVGRHHRFRRWKNIDRKKQPTEFFCVIRGAESKVTDEPLGFPSLHRDTNPWKHADEADLMERVRAFRQRSPEMKYGLDTRVPAPRRRPTLSRHAPVYQSPEFTPVRPYVNVAPPVPAPPPPPPAPPMGFPPYGQNVPYLGCFPPGPPPPAPPPPPLLQQHQLGHPMFSAPLFPASRPMAPTTMMHPPPPPQPRTVPSMGCAISCQTPAEYQRPIHLHVPNVVPPQTSNPFAPFAQQIPPHWIQIPTPPGDRQFPMRHQPTAASFPPAPPVPPSPFAPTPPPVEPVCELSSTGRPLAKDEGEEKDEEPRAPSLYAEDQP